MTTTIKKAFEKYSIFMFASLHRQADVDQGININMKTPTDNLQ